MGTFCCHKEHGYLSQVSDNALVWKISVFLRLVNVWDGSKKEGWKIGSVWDLKWRKFGSYHQSIHSYAVMPVNMVHCISVQGCSRGVIFSFLPFHERYSFIGCSSMVMFMLFYCFCLKGKETASPLSWLNMQQQHRHRGEPFLHSSNSSVHKIRFCALAAHVLVVFS